MGTTPSLDTGAFLGLAVSRLEALGRASDVPFTWFVIGRDLDDDHLAQELGELVLRGHEVANHSENHPYHLVNLPIDRMRAEIEVAALRIRERLGVAPRGFRAPGYALSDALVAVLKDAGYEYDSSLFPCPGYWLAKQLVLGAQRVRGRRGDAISGSLRAQFAPREPYRCGRPYFHRGHGLVELPIAVTRRLRLPVIGTSLSFAGPERARWLMRGVVGDRMIVLELHAIDVLDQSDGLSELARHQPDVAIPSARKLDTLEAVIGQLRASGYSFVTLSEAARVAVP